MIDEGYIKFTCEWNPTDPVPEKAILALNQTRQSVYDLGLIGAYTNGIGFGNVSQRYKDNQLIITGSATGNLPVLTHQHYALVTHFDIKQNTVWCDGPIQASSETMSHAAIYQACPEINAVIHIHNLEIWKTLLYHLPTTPADVRYGTPEMAKAIIELLKDDDLRYTGKIFAMAGHEEGLMVFGKDLEEAMERICCLVDCGI